ncbi:DNA cytosine methyltransferase [Clostridium sp.]|uniref:DNA cytosine methyltransferase n=1 Tax=Clostridium sp. TaxID=1506 RepID=UPI003464A69E
MDNKFTFIDLFAGIGGFRQGFERAGFKCVFSAELDSHACEVYKENFGDDPKCDITQLDPSQIPDFDILCAGFPCQAFSISGKQKGFYDDTRGTLFFDIIRVLKEKQPTAFVLENVQNLETHDNGNTLRVMLDSLHQLGYTVNFQVLNAKDFNVPQNRERIILVGNQKGFYFDFSLIQKTPAKPIKYYLDAEGDFEYLNPDEYTILTEYKQQPKSGLIFIGYRNKKIRTVGVRPGTEHLSRVHKQPNRIYSSEGMHPTIASQETGGRYWIYHEGRVRKLTINECFKFMGFPCKFKKIGLKSKLYERIGNSVCVNMVEAIAIQVYNQIFKGGTPTGTVLQQTFEKEVAANAISLVQNSMTYITPQQFLENIYIKANSTDFAETQLTKKQLGWVKSIVEKEETLKGVYSVLVSSLTYKSLYPEQDVRYHKIELENGYSGRSFDTKYVTPFLKSKKFFGAMKESGWLTRSLEQAHPFTLDFPGKISNKVVKDAFLQILNDVEENNANSEIYLTNIFGLSLIEKAKKTVKLINPVKPESSLNIDQIIQYLEDHFYYKYSSRGASILPVLAFYSIYECLIQEMGRYKNKKLDKLGSHTSCDRSSKATGDIVIRDKTKNELYEVIEIKFDIAPNAIMINDAYEKFKSGPVQRYYVLSTSHADEEEQFKIDEEVIRIREEHGCQVIVNGIFPSLKYYLRLLENTDSFMNKYIENLEKNSELNFEHKIAWNRILSI